MNRELMLAQMKPQLLKSFLEQGSSVELFSDGVVYTVVTYIDGVSSKREPSFYDSYREADMAFQDAVLVTTGKGTLH